jgi:H+/gluconate symporter-like permease
MPGTPSIHNVISSVALGTDLFAGFWIGLSGGLLMFITGIWYLERQRELAAINGDHFVPGPGDRISSIDEVCYPHWLISCLPLLLVLSTIILPRLMTLVLGPEAFQAEGQLFAVLRFADSQPIVWPSLALMLGSLLAVLIFAEVRENALNVLGSGTQDSIMPLINTAAVIGFGGVVTHTAGFTAFSEVMLASDLPPLLSAFASVSLVSAITGSASGGLQIFMQTMAPAYLEMGIDAEVLHRIATMASGGFDSLPHCGAIVAMLTITGLTHKEAYRDIGVITVVIPVLVTLAMIGVVAIVS